MNFSNLLKSGAAPLTCCWLVAACSSGDGDGNSGGAGSGSAGTNATAGSAGTNATAGSAGAAQGGGGASSAGSANASGSGGSSAGSGTGGSGGAGGSGMEPRCTGPQRDFPDLFGCPEQPGFSFSIWDYELATPTVAGQPYAIEIDVFGKGTPTIVIWGGNAECVEKAEPVFEQMLPVGQHCLVLQPTAAYTHLVVGITGGMENTERVRGVCSNGSCS